jgi:hypothetical protein
MKIGLCRMTLLWLAPAFGQTTAYGRRGLPMAYRIWRASGGLEPTEPCIRCFLIQVGFFLGAESKTGVVEGGVLPYQPWAAAKVRQLTQRMEFDPTGHCHYGGIPHAMYFSFQILETPQLIAVLHENMHAWRLISMDGSHHATDYSAWMGDSRGHWEGNTLVVDVADNNDKSVFYTAGHFHRCLACGGAVHARRSGHDQLPSEIDDSKVFTRRWNMGFPLKRAPKDHIFLESGCFEDRRDPEHLVKDHSALPAGLYQQ